MKSWMIAAATALTLAACSQPAPTTEETPVAAIPVNVTSGAFTLDPYHTTITVRAKHFGLSNYALRLNGVTGTSNPRSKKAGQLRLGWAPAITATTAWPRR